MGGGTEVSSGTALLRDLSRLGIYSQGRIYDSLDAKEGQTKLESSKFWNSKFGASRPIRKQTKREESFLGQNLGFWEKAEFGEISN